MQLCELVDIRLGFPLDRKRADFINQKHYQYKMLTMKSFNQQHSVDLDLLDTYMANSQIEPEYLTQDHDIIMRLRTPLNTIYINQKQTGIVIPSIMAVIRNIYPNILNNKFLVYYLNSDVVTKQLYNKAQGSGIVMIKIRDLMKLEIELPDIQKQMRLVNYLETANHEISLINRLAEQKTKLKQQVFDSILDSRD